MRCFVVFVVVVVMWESKGEGVRVNVAAFWTFFRSCWTSSPSPMAFSISRELLSSFTLREHLLASGRTSLHPLCRSSTSYYLLPTTTYSLPYTTQLHLSGSAC